VIRPSSFFFFFFFAAPSPLFCVNSCSRSMDQWRVLHCLLGRTCPKWVGRVQPSPQKKISKKYFQKFVTLPRIFLLNFA
jgi:hypothetical protein